MTAQAGLANSLQPALDHILKVFSTWAPGRVCLKTGYLLQQYDKFKILKWWKCANWKISCKDCLTAQVWDILCFCQCFTLFVILLVGYYHTNFSVVALGLRLVGQLRDEIFLLLHSALQLHYLKVAQTNWISLVGKRTQWIFSKPRSTIHPSLKTSMVFREQLPMKGINNGESKE